MATQTKTLKVQLEGRGNFTLRPDDYKTQGGEGMIYRTGDTIVKIYLDAGKMRQDGMVEKIRKLSRLKHETIVAPQGIVSDSSGNPIGYYMPFAQGEPMSRVFTNDFRQRERFTDEAAKVLSAGMHETVCFAHSARALMVDANELNWLVYLSDRKKPSPRVIDVDSWVIDGQMPKIVAKMPSIRDWHSKLVSVESDWFAWGVVTFQVFTGIHPYKGTLAGYKPSEFIERMKAKKSVFTSGVSLNRVVRDFSCIPAPLLAWYEATFQNVERSVPPSPMLSGTQLPRAAQVLRVVSSATGSLTFEKLYSVTGNPVLRVYSCGVVLCSDGSLVELGMKRTIGTVTARDVEVVKVAGGWLVGTVENDSLEFRYIDSSSGKAETMKYGLTAHGLFRSDNRLFAISDRGITELSITLLGKPVLSAGNTWGALPNSTKWFDGVGVQDALGAAFLLVPFGEKACAIPKVPELDAIAVIAAKAGPRYAVLSTVDRNGDYERIEITFDRDYSKYTVVRTPVDSPDLNVAILPKGVAASISTDGELTITVPTANKVSKVADKQISTDMILCNWGDKVLYIHNGDVWSVRTR
ncbi:MAG: hypothetical protein Q8L52_03475 [bacterium]|nr:hypothetical protein [bacterium]